MDNKETIIARARKLAAMTEDRGCTAEEAAVAAEKLATLAEEYDLDVAAILRDGKKGDGIVKQSVIIPTACRTLSGWRDLAAGISQSFTVELIHTRTFDEKFRKRHFAVFVGYTADVACAAYLFETTLQKLIQRAKETCAHQASFIIGAAWTIVKRLEARKQTATTSATNNSLAILPEAKLHEINNFIQSEIKPEKARQSKGSNIDARSIRQGMLFGQQTPLTQGLAAAVGD